MTAEPGLYGLIEAGGTKFVCGVGSTPSDIRNRVVIPTRTPEQTLQEVEAYFRGAITQHGPIKAIGMGCFGPIDLNRGAPSFGCIGKTNKPGWEGTDIVGRLAGRLGVEVRVDTDVNAALYAEAKHGAGQGMENLAFVTVGTGIGAGLMVGGQIVHGVSHPEVGHMMVEREPDDLDFEGVCDFHGARCFEGVASGPSMKARWGMAGFELPEAHPGWDLQARYLAKLCINISMMIMPERIIFGGGVMQQPHLYSRISQHFARLINGYNGFDCSAD